eukprot:scaffold7615_cov86-Skeletonema_dohrnii-CCMP3373.AAC.3
MSKRVSNIPSAGDKKRKEVSVAANNESGPPKKKHRYECSAEGCTNIVQIGGVCVRHGARRKRCISEGCTNKAVKGGVCWTHGGKVERKLCSVGNCTKQAQKGGVCHRHRTQSIIAPPPAQANFLCGDIQGGGNQNYATVVEVSDNEGEGGKKHSPIAGRKRKSGVSKQQSHTAASNYTGEDGPVHPTRRSTRLSKLRKLDCIEDAAYTELEGNVDGNEEGEEPADRAPSDVRPQKRTRGEGNLNDDKEQDASDDVAPVKEGEGGIGVAMEDGDSCGGDDQNEYDSGGGDDGDVNSEEGKHSHVVPEEITATANDAEKESELLRLSAKLEEANNVINEKSEELEAIKSRSKSEHEQTELLRSRLNGVEAQIDEKNDIIAELEEELEAEKVKKAEMDTQLMTTATARLEERVAKDAANAKLWEMTKKFEAAKLRWKTWWKEQKERFFAELADTETHLKANSHAVVKLKAEVGKLQATKDEMQAQMQIATNNEVVLRSKVEELTKELKEVTTKFEAAESFWNSRREEKKIYAELNRTKSQLRVKSDAVTELSELNASLRNQLEKQSKGGSEVKEEELTDDEDITARLKERRMAANEQMKVMTAKVDFAVLEVGKRDVELEQAKAENEELRRALNEERRQKRFKVKYSPRMKQQERDKRL